METTGKLDERKSPEVLDGNFCARITSTAKEPVLLSDEPLIPQKNYQLTPANASAKLHPAYPESMDPDPA